MSRAALVVIAAALLAPSAAVADEKKPPPPADDGISIAVGANLPFGWRSRRQSVAGSVLVGFGRHHAVRATLARHPFLHNIGLTVVELIASRGEAEGSLMLGEITEVGVGWQYFAGTRFRGPVLEAGVFRRHIDGVEDYRFSQPEYIATDTVGYGVRGLVGWSWRFWGEHVFFATAFGLGMARHTGTETTSLSTYDRDDRTESVTRYQASPEFYVRVGGAIDL